METNSHPDSPNSSLFSSLYISYGSVSTKPWSAAELVILQFLITLVPVYMVILQVKGENCLEKLILAIWFKQKWVFSITVL